MAETGGPGIRKRGLFASMFGLGLGVLVRGGAAAQEVPGSEVEKKQIPFREIIYAASGGQESQSKVAAVRDEETFRELWKQINTGPPIPEAFQGRITPGFMPSPPVVDFNRQTALIVFGEQKETPYLLRVDELSEEAGRINLGIREARVEEQPIDALQRHARPYTIVSIDKVISPEVEIVSTVTPLELANT